MEVLGEPCASFREVEAITSKLTVFTLCYLIVLFWGIFGQKLGWGRHLQSGSRLIQMSLAIPVVLCDITDITEGAKM